MVCSNCVRSNDTSKSRVHRANYSPSVHPASPALEEACSILHCSIDLSPNFSRCRRIICPCPSKCQEEWPIGKSVPAPKETRLRCRQVLAAWCMHSVDKTSFQATPPEVRYNRWLVRGRRCSLYFIPEVRPRFSFLWFRCPPTGLLYA